MLKNKKNSDITLVTKGVIAHGVNCKGAFGAGVALAIRERWPSVYDCYQRNTRLGDELLGSCHIIRVDDELWVANCYTQLSYGGDGKRYASPEAISRSLEFAFIHATATSLELHAPRIGAGLGGLDWGTEVLPIFEELNSEYDGVNVVIHTI
jgi:Predicted phosphatase homologous to the C-terminal domain of histone macroH2A1